MKTLKQEGSLKVMAKKESVKIEVISGEEKNSKIFVMSLNIGGLDLYQKAKATKKFIDNDTKVLETLIETHLREFLRSVGIIPQDGSKLSLEKALLQLELKGMSIDIIDRYYELGGERIIGLSSNDMTVIEEGNILSCAMEVIIKENEQ